MSRRGARDLVIGLLLAGVAFLGTLYQVNESTASANQGQGEHVPKLFCPLH
ncbi:MAG: hypothetical protein ACAH82_08250 [Solirubrobacteraceae bacterium]